jgi:hypothetical protein
MGAQATLHSGHAFPGGVKKSNHIFAGMAAPVKSSARKKMNDRRVNFLADACDRSLLAAICRTDLRSIVAIGLEAPVRFRVHDSPPTTVIVAVIARARLAGGVPGSTRRS